MNDIKHWQIPHFRQSIHHAISTTFAFADDYAPTSEESTDAMMVSLVKHLPEYLRIQNDQVLPQAQAELNAAKAISPEYLGLLNNLYSQYAPQLAKTGVGVENINRVGAAQTDLDILKGPGKELVTEAQGLDKILNPEFYNTRASAGDALGKMLAGIENPDFEGERLLNQEEARSGNYTPNASSTVANALSFGDRKTARLSNALNLATNFLQPSQGQFNPIQTALGRPSTNTGEQRFTGVQQPGNQAYESGNQLFGQIGQLKQQQNDINANRSDLLDKITPDSVSI